MSAAPRVFYGWYVVYAVGVVMTTAAGLAFYNLSVLLDAFIEQRGFAVAETSFATSCFFVAAGISGILTGFLIDRFDVRLVMSASGCLSGAALACIGQINEVWQLYLFYVAFGLAYGGCALVPAITVVTRWFEAQRPLALAIASTGLSLGGIVLTPVSAMLIKQFGIEGAAPWLGLTFFLGVVPASALVIRASPQSMGLSPDGRRRAKHELPADMGGVPFAEALRSRFFGAITLAYVFAFAGQVGGIAHLFRLISIRTDPHLAAVALSVLALASLVGRLGAGWLLSRMSAREFALAIIAIQGAALAFLAVAESQMLLLIGVICLGIAIGNVLMMLPLLLAEAFGARDYGRIFSLSQFVTVLGVAGGPALVGLLYQLSGGYELAYLAMATASLLACATAYLAGPAAHKGQSLRRL